MAIVMDELVQAGLCDESEEHHLTSKGRDWMHRLEELYGTESMRSEEAAEDLILSTSGLIR